MPHFARHLLKGLALMVLVVVFLLILVESMRRPRFELLIGLFVLLSLISILLREGKAGSLDSVAVCYHPLSILCVRFRTR